MKTGTSLALVVITPLTLAPHTPAQEEGGIESIAKEATESSRAMANSSKETIKGVVELIDRKNRSVSVREKSGNVTTAVVRSDTKIFREGMTVHLVDLRKGDEVKIKNPG